MKKFFSIILSFLICAVSFGGAVFAQESEICVFFNGNQIVFDVAPQMINDRTMVPIRGVFETMGAQVVWEEETRTAICTKENTVVKMTVGSDLVQIDDRYVQTDMAPLVQNGRILAPARFAAEAFGAKVTWNAQRRYVIICTDNVYVYADFPGIPDFGKYYGLQPFEEEIQQGFYFCSYLCDDKTAMQAGDEGFAFGTTALGYDSAVTTSVGGYPALFYRQNGTGTSNFFISAMPVETYGILYLIAVPLSRR